MRTFLGIAGFFLLLLAIGLALPFLIDLNKYQDRYRPLIEDALNRKVTLQDIRLTIWPRIGARVAGFTVQDDPSFRTGPFASLSSLDVGVKLLPLLRGRIDVEEITLREPVILVLKNKAGVLNISTLGSQAPAVSKPEAPPREPAGGPLRALALLAVDKVSIDGGKLTYRDESVPNPVEYAVHDLEFLLTSVHLGDTARLHMAAAVQPYNIPITLDGSFGPLTETLDIKHFDLDAGLRRMTISAKGGAVDGNLDVTASSSLIDSADIPVTLPLTKPVQVKNFHVKAHANYGGANQAQLWDTLEVKDLGLALVMGQSVVNVKGTAARGIAHLTAASADLSSDDFPVGPTLVKPVVLRNLHLSARVPYPLKKAVHPLELGDVTDLGVAVAMGNSTADIHGTVKGGVAQAVITSKGLNTGDLPIAVPLKKPVQISGLQAAVEGTTQEARIKNLVLEVFGGSVKGQGSMGLGSVSPPFHANLTADGLKVEPMAEAAGLTSFSASGTAAANVSMKGRGLRMPDLTKTLEGTGNLALRNGVLRGPNLLQEVAALLKVAGLSPDEIKTTVFSVIESDFVVREGVVTVRRFLMESRDFQAAGNGTIGFDHTVRLRMNMNLSPSLSRRIAGASPIAQLALSEGRLSVPLLITGTIQSPSYGLDTKVFSGKVQEQAKRKAKEAVQDLLEGKTSPEEMRQQGKSLLKDLFRR
ncbi:MAG TPA: AsmA family protein [Nitrospiraceae bacterium]|nr:AsmA family protein [Nitrospiraceae bacterium]